MVKRDDSAKITAHGGLYTVKLWSDGEPTIQTFPTFGALLNALATHFKEREYWDSVHSGKEK